MLITKFNQFLHKHGQTMFAVLLVLLIFPFVLWGTISPSNKRESRPAGEIFGRKVPDTEFRDAQNAIYAQYVMLTGNPEPQRVLEYLREQAWDRLLLLKAADRLEIRVSSAEVDAYLARFPLLSTDGQLDPAKVNGLVQRILQPRTGMDWPQLRSALAESIRADRVRQLIMETAHVTPAELRDAYDRLNEQYVAVAARFPVEEDTSAVEIPEEEVGSFFDENRARFRIPEQRTIRFVRFGPREALELQAIQVTDEEVKARYDARREEYVGDEYVDDEGQQKPFDEVADTIRAEMVRHRARVWASEQSSRMTADLITEEGEPVDDFEGVATSRGVEVAVTRPFSLGDVPEELPKSAGLDEQIRGLAPESPYSDPIIVGDDYYILALGDTVPAREAELAEVRDEVVAELQSRKARDAARAAAENARAAVEAARADGADCAAAFEQAGVEHDKPEPFSRRNPPTGTALSPIEILSAAADLGPGELSEAIEGPGAYGIVCLESKSPPSDEDFERDRELVRQQYLMQKRQMVLEEYRRHMEEVAGLKKYPGFGGDLPSGS